MNVWSILSGLLSVAKMVFGYIEKKQWMDAGATKQNSKMLETMIDGIQKVRKERSRLHSDSTFRDQLRSKYKNRDS